MSKRNKQRRRKPRARQRRPARPITNAEIQIATVLLWVLIGISAIVALQPWMAIGEIAVNQVEIIPFYGVLSRLPLIGRVITWFEGIAWGTAVSIVGVALCMTINIIQVAGGTKVSTTQWVLRGIGGLFEVFVAVYYHAPYDGGIEALVADFPYLDPYYLNVEGAVMTFMSVLLFELLFLYGSEYIRGMKSEYQAQLRRADEQPDAA